MQNEVKHLFSYPHKGSRFFGLKPSLNDSVMCSDVIGTIKVG